MILYDLRNFQMFTEIKLLKQTLNKEEHKMHCYYCYFFDNIEGNNRICQIFRNGRRK